jgi:hypothetical protein
MWYDFNEMVFKNKLKGIKPITMFYALSAHNRWKEEVRPLMRKGLLPVALLIVSFMLYGCTQFPGLTGTEVQPTGTADQQLVGTESNTQAQGPPAIEHRVFIHWERPGKGSPPPGKGGGGKKEKCYSDYFARWQETTTFNVNPDGSGLTSPGIVADLSSEEWDSGAYSGWGGVTFNIFDDAGPGSTTKTAADVGIRDGENTIVWSALDPGIIAVTHVWYYVGGPPHRRAMVEFDIIFNTYYTWGDASSDPNVMDFQNIATHELGHGIGMDDLYQEVAINETMYGYSSTGEAIKRDLYCGDREGATKLYR